MKHHKRGEISVDEECISRGGGNKRRDPTIPLCMYRHTPNRIYILFYLLISSFRKKP